MWKAKGREQSHEVLHISHYSIFMYYCYYRKYTVGPKPSDNLARGVKLAFRLVKELAMISMLH